jgi:hypothetical protein
VSPRRSAGAEWEAPRAEQAAIRLNGLVIASDSDAIQTKPQPQSRSLDRLALLAMTNQSKAL